MEAVVDIARNFKVFIPSPAEVISFDMPSTIVFNRGEDNNVEVKISDGQAGDYDLQLSQRNLSGFSPHENMKESFEQIFNYYLYHSVTQRVTDLQKINIIIPLFSSVAFENLLLKVNEGKGVYRDVEVYSAYYLNESLDLPELNHFAEEDNGTHIYGIVPSRDYPYLYLVNYEKNNPPGIIDFMGTHSADDLFNMFKLMIKNQSFGKSQVFFFTEGEVKGLSEEFAEGQQHKAIEIEFEKYYRKFILTPARGSEVGAKKRYAGLLVENDKETIEFVGMESVRSDWTRLAKEFQLELYNRIFNNAEIENWLREIVKKVKTGEYDDKLVYRKRLRKEVDEYTKNIPQHVKAARMLPETTGTVYYVITKRGPVPIELKHTDIDYDHYIEKQIKPIADSVLILLGESFDSIVQSDQLSFF